MRTDSVGLVRKYTVIRNDGRDRPDEDKAGARYFVLDYVHDNYARVALWAYAEAVKVEHPQLSADLLRQLEETR